MQNFQRKKFAAGIGCGRQVHCGAPYNNTAIQVPHLAIGSTDRLAEYVCNIPLVESSINWGNWDGG